MIAFHRFLIATAIVFCAALALWALGALGAAGVPGAPGRPDGGRLVLGAAFAVAALLLAYYLKNLRRFLRR